MKDREMQMKKFNRHGGFTLLELIIVIAIIAILLALLVPNLTKFLGTATDTADKANLKTLNNVTKAYATQSFITHGDPVNNDIFNGISTDQAREQKLIDEGYMNELVKCKKTGDYFKWSVAEQVWQMGDGSDSGGGGGNKGTIMDQLDGKEPIEYNSNTGYRYGDFIIYKGVVYKFIDPKYVNEGRKVSPPGSGMSFWKKMDEVYDSNNYYETGDIVSKDGSYYKYIYSDGWQNYNPNFSKDFVKVKYENGVWVEE